MTNKNEIFNTDWRKIASTIYKKPVDSKIFGQSDIDVTLLEKFIVEKRKKGLKITLTHVFLKIISKCLQDDVPEFNTFLRRGKVKSRETIDVMVSVLQASGAMGSVLVKNANELSLEEIESELNKKVIEARLGKETHNKQSKNILTKLPWPFRPMFFKFYKLFTIKLGFSMPFIGLSANNFGSFILTNIGSIGLDTGYPALMPSSNVAFVFVMGGIQKKPVVVNDEIVIRRMMTVSVVIDHRLADASHGGKLLRIIKKYLRNPDLLDK